MLEVQRASQYFELESANKKTIFLSCKGFRKYYIQKHGPLYSTKGMTVA